MLTCFFEDNNKVHLRHVTTDALVIKENKILLVKRAAFLNEGGKYAMPGGYLDRDETTAQGVQREVQEETGYQCESVQLFRIIDNPVRGNEDRQNVNFVYLAKAGEQTGKPDHESAEVSWFDLNNLPPKDQIAFDHYSTIQLYMKYLHDPFALPFVG